MQNIFEGGCLGIEMVVNNVNNKTIVLVGWSGEQETNKEFF